MVLVRKNYDKPNRCPGWSGSGIYQYPWEDKYNANTECHDGHSGYYDDSYKIGNLADWNFHVCSECKTVTLPYILRYVDPEYWYSVRIAPNIRRFKMKMKRNIKSFMNNN